MKERCDVCDKHIEEAGELLDDVCRSCNPESHEWSDEEDEQQLWKE